MAMFCDTCGSHVVCHACPPPKQDILVLSYTAGLFEKKSNLEPFLTNASNTNLESLQNGMTVLLLGDARVNLESLEILAKWMELNNVQLFGTVLYPSHVRDWNDDRIVQVLKRITQHAKYVRLEADYKLANQKEWKNMLSHLVMFDSMAIPSEFEEMQGEMKETSNILVRNANVFYGTLEFGRCL